MLFIMLSIRMEVYKLLGQEKDKCIDLPAKFIIEEKKKVIGPEKVNVRLCGGMNLNG